MLSRRRPLAALLAGAAVLAGLHEVRPPAPATEQVLTAARDLPAGTVLADDDLRSVAYAEGTAPAGLARKPVGRVLAAPLRAGEPVTDVRVLGRSLVAAYPGTVAMPVRLPDAAMAALLRVGDRIDLVAADPQGAAPARLVGSELPVVVLPGATQDDASGALAGRLVVLAVPQSLSEEIAQASVTGFLTFTFSR